MTEPLLDHFGMHPSFDQQAIVKITPTAASVILFRTVLPLG